jgi:hypothetical protein
VIQYRSDKNAQWRFFLTVLVLFILRTTETWGTLIELILTIVSGTSINVSEFPKILQEMTCSKIDVFRLYGLLKWLKKFSHNSKLVNSKLKKVSKLTRQNSTIFRTVPCIFFLHKNYIGLPGFLRHEYSDANPNARLGLHVTISGSSLPVTKINMVPVTQSADVSG